MAAAIWAVIRAASIMPGARARDVANKLPKPPTEYLKKVYFDTVVFTPHQLEYLVKVFGADHILMGTDYPFDMADYDPVGHVVGDGDARRENRRGDHRRECEEAIGTVAAGQLFGIMRYRQANTGCSRSATRVCRPAITSRN